MIRDVTVDDLALIELHDSGSTGAPPSVLQNLQSRGYLTLSGGAPTLTARGKERAKQVKPAEGSLRARAAASVNGGTQLQAIAGGFHT